MSVWGEIRNKSLGIEPRLENTEIIFPIVRKVSPRVMSVNLTPVKPLAPPKGKLMYMF